MFQIRFTNVICTICIISHLVTISFSYLSPHIHLSLGHFSLLFSIYDSSILCHKQTKSFKQKVLNSTVTTYFSVNLWRFVVSLFFSTLERQKDHSFISSFKLVFSNLLPLLTSVVHVFVWKNWRGKAFCKCKYCLWIKALGFLNVLLPGVTSCPGRRKNLSLYGVLMSYLAFLWDS